MIPLAFIKLLEGSSLEVKQRERDGVVILDLDGRLVQGDGDSALREHLASLLEAGRRNLILNFKRVDEIDPKGLGTLEYCGGKFRESGGRCVLLNVHSDNAKLSDVFKLGTAFETYQDEMDAVNSFFPDRKVPHYDILEFVGTLDHHRNSPEESDVPKS